MQNVPFYVTLFFKILKKLSYGKIEIIGPNQESFLFKGLQQKGPTVKWEIHDWIVIKNLLLKFDLGLGEDYMKGLWDTDDLYTFLYVALQNQHLFKSFTNRWFFYFFGKIINFLQRNTKTQSKKNIQKHYDLGNNFYRLWLDKSMTYSSALFHGNEKIKLEEAQKAKYKRILEKIGKNPCKILDIGCGWGGFVKEAAKSGHEVLGITISKEQYEWAKENIKDIEGAKIKLIDYRDIKGTFDVIVSIGMFEHVGEKFWPIYMKTVYEHLKPNGKAIIQSILCPEDEFEHQRYSVTFIKKHIFPGGMLPSIGRLKSTAQKQKLFCQDIFCFGKDYGLTLKEWLNRFNKNSKKIQKLGYDEAFMRKWRFYLAGCQAAFDTGHTDVAQFFLKKYTF